MLCSEAIKVNANEQGGQAATLKCKRWSCPICAPDNRRRVIRLGQRGNPDKMLTLTSRLGSYESPDAAAQAMRDHFAKLVRMIRKRWPASRFEYLRVFEATQNGWPHMHLLIRAPFIPQRWLSAAWGRLHGAPQVDIRSIKNKEHYKFYVTKYIGKDLHRFAGVTRWFRSKGYDDAPADDRIAVRFGSRWDKIDTTANLYFHRNKQHVEHYGGIVEEYRLGYMLWKWPLARPG